MYFLANLAYLAVEFELLKLLADFYRIRETVPVEQRQKDFTERRRNHENREKSAKS
jgi:hypothetical protein